MAKIETTVQNGKGYFPVCFFLTILFLIPLSALNAFQNSTDNVPETRTVTAYQLKDTEQVQLDGKLREPFWKHAVPATGFIQQEPVEGAPATEETEVYILYNEDALYIGAVFYDRNTGGIIAYQKQRDAETETDDRFVFILDTFLDGRTGYYFEINPAGLMGDGLLGRGIGFSADKSWNGIWIARVARRDDGWSAEIRIPFSTLNFNPEQETWGINFHRTIRRKNEETRWNGYRRNQDILQPVHAGRLTGLRGISQGLYHFLIVI